MRPTLYADDLNVGLYLGHGALSRVLPRRCLACRGANPGHRAATAPGPNCKGCDGPGFRTPDPPDWWIEWQRTDFPSIPMRVHWEATCRDTWRLLGILEED